MCSQQQKVLPGGTLRLLQRLGFQSYLTLHRLSCCHHSNGHSHDDMGVCKAAELAADVTGYSTQVTRGWAFDYFTSFDDIFQVTPENVTNEDIELHLSSIRGRGSSHPKGFILDEQIQLDARCFVHNNACKKGESNLNIAMFADWIDTTHNVKVNSTEVVP